MEQRELPPKVKKPPRLLDELASDPVDINDKGWCEIHTSLFFAPSSCVRLDSIL